MIILVMLQLVTDNTIIICLIIKQIHDGTDYFLTSEVKSVYFH